MPFFEIQDFDNFMSEDIFCSTLLNVVSYSPMVILINCLSLDIDMNGRS